MCSREFYGVVGLVNNKLSINRLTHSDSNWWVLYVLAFTFGVNITKSRSKFIECTNIDIAQLRKLTDNALRHYKTTGQFKVDERLRVSIAPYNPRLDVLED